MSGPLMSLVGKRVLAESARNHFGQEVSLYLGLFVASIIANQYCLARTHTLKKSLPLVYPVRLAKRLKNGAKLFRLACPRTMSRC